MQPPVKPGAKYKRPKSFDKLRIDWRSLGNPGTRPNRDSAPKGLRKVDAAGAKYAERQKYQISDFIFQREEKQSSRMQPRSETGAIYQRPKRAFIE
jgi:hypothetical protein